MCFCGDGSGRGSGVGGGGGIDGSDGGGDVDGSGGNSGVGDGGESVVYRVVGVVGVLCIGVLEVDCVGVVDILVLGGVFVVEVVEGVELVVVCVVRLAVRLVLWCVSGRGYFLCCFSLKLVELNELSVGWFPFGMVIWADCFILLEWGFLGKIVGTYVFMMVLLICFYTPMSWQ